MLGEAPTGGLLLKLGGSAEFLRNGFMCSLTGCDGAGERKLGPQAGEHGGVSPDVLESCLANAISSARRELFPTSPPPAQRGFLLTLSSGWSLLMPFIYR